MRHIGVGLLIVLSLSCCSNINENKYTVADRMFVSELIRISGNNSKMLDDLAIEMKKYPKMDYERIFNEIHLLLNNIENWKKITKPNNFLDVYDMWGNTLDEMKDALLSIDKGLEKHNSKYLSEGGTKMSGATRKMNDMTYKMKQHLKEAMDYENNKGHN